MDIVPAALEDYATAHTTPPTQALRDLADETRRDLDSPGMMVGALEGRVLEMLVFASSARRVLEIGTFSGYSAVSMAAALPEGGSIVTCELSEKHAEVARRHIAAAGFSDQVDVRVGRAIDTVGDLEGPFDFVFIDADKPSYIDYFEAVLPKLSERGLIAADNTLWSGRVVDSSDQEDDTKAIRAFNDHVAADDRVVQVMLTVRDGITLIRRRDPAS